MFFFEPEMTYGSYRSCGTGNEIIYLELRLLYQLRVVVSILFRFSDSISVFIKRFTPAVPEVERPTGVPETTTDECIG